MDENIQSQFQQRRTPVWEHLERWPEYAGNGYVTKVYKVAEDEILSLWYHQNPADPEDLRLDARMVHTTKFPAKFGDAVYEKPEDYFALLKSVGYSPVADHSGKKLKTLSEWAQELGFYPSPTA